MRDHIFVAAQGIPTGYRGVHRGANTQWEAKELKPGSTFAETVCDVFQQSTLVGMSTFLIDNFIREML